MVVAMVAAEDVVVVVAYKITTKLKHQLKVVLIAFAVVLGK